MKRILLAATAPAALCLAIAHAAAQQAITTPYLWSDQNFRDLAGVAASYGGTGFANVVANDGVMRTGIFYRSEVLNLSPGDHDTLSSLNITQDIDLRTPQEISETADWPPTGASYVRINVYGSNSPPEPFNPGAPYPTPTTQAEAEADFAVQYGQFVSDPKEASGFGAVLLDLAHSSGSALYHCSAGKDRTGWTSFLLETIAGVDLTTRINDYLATNAYSATEIGQEYQAAVAQYGAAVANIIYPLLGVQESFLQTALAEVSALYPEATLDESLHDYLTQGMGLTQADIYVLRAKMVDYLSLPGQGAFVGNAAAGAAFLNALQNSPLSGAYTAFNYYLQSAIDAGTLGGVQAQVGGQARADAAAFLARQPFRLDAALAPYVDGRGLAPGQAQMWMGGLVGDFATSAHDGAASSAEHSAGTLAGLTYRIDAKASAFFALGYEWGSVGSAGGSANVDSAIGVVGARYGFASLEAGPFVAARASLSGVDYQGARTLGGGLGQANGGAPGAMISGQAVFGDVIPLPGFTVTPQAGVRVVRLDLGGFQESGGQLALAVDRLGLTTPSLLGGVEMGFNPWRAGGWTITPTVPLAAELTLGAAKASTSGSLYGFSVSQSAAYDSRYLLQGGVSVAARRGAFAIKAEVDATHGANSNGVNGQVSLALSF